MYRCLEVVNLNNLIWNYEKLKGLSTDIIAVVKCDAYGLGAKKVVGALSGVGATKFQVATIYEGIEIRREYKDIEIIVLGFIEDYNLLIRYNLTPVIYDDEGLNIVKTLKIPFYIKINTGMNRLGFRSIDKEKLIGQNVLGVMSHLGAADGIDPESQAQTLRQIEDFKREYARIQDALKFKIKGYLNNSAGLVNYGGEFGARTGIALYGGMDGFKDVVSIYARVIDKYFVKAGAYIGYDLGYRAKKDLEIGIISIGYGDGIPRALSNNLTASVNGEILKEVGLISMDSMALDVTNKKVQKNDVVKLNLNLKNNPYELLCGINKRVKRKYVTVDPSCWLL